MKEQKDVLSSIPENVESHLDDRIKKNISSQQDEALLQAEANKMSLLISSDNDLMSRYQKNLAAFKEYYPDIYNFFINYEPLKHVIDTTDGFVNALNVETGAYFYEYPSFLSTKVQFDQFIHSPNIKKFNFNSEDLNENEAKFIHVDSLDAMLSLLPKKGKQKKTSDNSSKQLSSLMIFGVGAGYHIELFAKQYNISCLYIIEPDVDLFFLSLFSINWTYILETFEKKGTIVYISIGEQKETFFDELMHKSADNGRYQMAHVAGYVHYHSKQINELLTEFNHRYLELGHGWGFFDDAVMSIGHTLTNLGNDVPILKKLAVNNKTVSDIPVFIIGNGSSLDGLIDTIKLYQNKAIIISCGSALSALYEYGIKPDFHCEQERTFPVAEKIEHYCPSSFLDDICLLGPTTVHPAVFSMFQHSMMAAKMNEPSSALLLNDAEGSSLFTAYHFINPTVANTALVMGYNLGFKNFYLFGIDLGHKKGGNHHSKKSLYYTEDEQDRELYNSDDTSAIMVKGNFGGEFVCDTFFYQSNMNLSKQILAFDDLTCFNLSDGAYVNGSEPLKSEQAALKFNNQTTLNKMEVVSLLIKEASHEDPNKKLSQRLSKSLDYQYFDDVCQRLDTLNDQKVSSFEQAAALLLNNTIILSSLTELAYSLLQGTIMHMQVVLTQLLYEPVDEIDGVNAFNKGLVFYREFLQIAPEYYRNQAEKAHYIIDANWIVKLREK